MGIINFESAQQLFLSVSSTADLLKEPAVKNAERSILEDLAQKRKEYIEGLASKHELEKQLQCPAQISAMLGEIGIEVYHAYLSQLKTRYTPYRSDLNFKKKLRICSFDITKWVWNKDENYLEKLINVYHVLCHENCNLALLFDRTPEKVTVSVAIANTGKPIPTLSESYLDLIIKAIKGNFPGTNIVIHSNDCCNNDEKTLPISLLSSSLKLEMDQPKSVAVVSNVATTKSEKFISQSIEKVLDGIVPISSDDSYTIILLASPVSDEKNWRNRLCQLSSALQPFAAGQTNYSVTSTTGNNETISLGANAGINTGLSVTPFGIGINTSANFGLNYSSASSVTLSEGKTEGITKNWKNQMLIHTQEHLDMQIKRIDLSSALGLWNFAAYCISESWVTAKHVASMYLALTQGETSYITDAPINIWKGADEKQQVIRILKNLQCLQHPLFILDPDKKFDQAISENNEDAIELIQEDKRDWFMYPTLVDATNMVTGSELAYSLNRFFPMLVAICV